MPTSNLKRFAPGNKGCHSERSEESRRGQAEQRDSSSGLKPLLRMTLTCVACTGISKQVALWVAGLCLLASAGCLAGPNYQPQPAPMPEAWTGPTDQMTAAPEKQAALVQWWTTFNDPVMTSLVERAVQSNLDLKVAAARLQAARATYGIASADQWPQFGASANYTRSRGSAMNGPNPLAAHSLFQVGLDASYEVDVFGGVARNVEAAGADVEAAAWDSRDVLVSVAAEVALDYMNLRGFQQRIVIAQRNLKDQQRNAELTRQRQKGGFVSGLDVANAEAQVASTAAAIPLFESQARQAIYSLGVLLGQPPAALLKELGPPAEIPGTPPEVPIALPSELLRRRPDLRRAEAQVHAATARIGVATADLFPRFSLNASAGFQSNTLDTLFSGRNGSFSFGPAAAYTIFDGGRIDSNIDLNAALTDQAILTYQKTVLVALQDVENALIAYAKEQENHKFLVEAVAANRKALDISTRLYTEGQTDFLSVLIAERDLFASEDALVQSTQALSTQLVALYKALGGGWNLEPPPPATAPGPEAGLIPASHKAFLSPRN
jgi:outer membrane protein, multidrug efflux system